MTLKRLLFLSRTTAFLVITAGPAWAVQTHGGAEGLVSHELGHILFISGMAYMLFRLYRIRIHDPGWSEFRVFLWLIVAWNFLTFTGHWMDEIVPAAKFIRSAGQTRYFVVSDISDAFFYLTRLDHLLLIPAFVFLLLALRKWRKSD